MALRRFSGYAKMPDMNDRTQTIKQAARYLLVGFSSAAIELGLFFVFDSLLGFDVRIASAIGLTCATVYNFYLNFTYTFKNATNLKRSLILYILLFVFNQLFSTFFIVFLIDFGIVSTIAKVLTMGCIVLWNFALYRKLVFK